MKRDGTISEAANGLEALSGVFADLERSDVSSLYEARLSGQRDRDMDDLGLAPHAQWKTTRLEQLEHGSVFG